MWERCMIIHNKLFWNNCKDYTELLKERNDWILWEMEKPQWEGPVWGKGQRRQSKVNGHSLVRTCNLLETGGGREQAGTGWVIGYYWTKFQIMITVIPLAFPDCIWFTSPKYKSYIRLASSRGLTLLSLHFKWIFHWNLPTLAFPNIVFIWE